MTVMTEYRSLPLRSIRPHPENPRFDLGDLTELTADIRDAGLIEPLVVIPGSWGKARGECRDCGVQVERTTAGVLLEHDGCPGGSEPAGDDWYLLAGHRRHAASLTAGLWEVPCRVVFDVKTAAEALVVMLRENGHRRDLTPLEEAHGYERLTLFGLTATKIAQQTHRSKKTVDRRMALSRLPEQAKTRLRHGTITLADAEAMLDLPAEKAERVLRSVGTKEFRQEVAREHLPEGRDSAAEVAESLRADFLAPFLAGTQKVPARDHDRVLRQVVGTLTTVLPRPTVRAWCLAVGVGEAIELSTIPPLRALVGMAAVTEKSTEGIYDLLESMGYEPSPVELDLLGGDAA